MKWYWMVLSILSIKIVQKLTFIEIKTKNLNEIKMYILYFIIIVVVDEVLKGKMENKLFVSTTELWLIIFHSLSQTQTEMISQGFTRLRIKI